VWTLGTVAAILGNPRYTGRQVWNRQEFDVQALHESSARGERQKKNCSAVQYDFEH